MLHTQEVESVTQKLKRQHLNGSHPDLANNLFNVLRQTLWQSDITTI
jgi:hypothetical protein